MPTQNTNTGRRIEAAYTLGLSDAREGQNVNPYSANRPNLRKSWADGHADAGVGEKHAITGGMSLATVCKPGDVVRVWMLPIEQYKLSANKTESDPYMEGADLPAIFAGTFTATVEATECLDCDDSGHGGGEGITLYNLSLSAYGDTSKPSECLEILSTQITHLQVIKAAPAPETISFGKLNCEWTRDRELRVNGHNVTPALVAAVWTMRGRVLPERVQFKDSELTGAWRQDIRLSPSGIAVGCASGTLEELGQALDWAAQKLGWV